MSDTSLPPTAPPPAAPLADERQTALIVYILMLVPFIVPVTHVVGLVMAYVSRDTAPDWLKSHYACLLCVVLIGFVLVPAVVVWYIVRCALGLSRLMRAEPYPTPESWTF
jgi:uncharacterized membrane protein